MGALAPLAAFAAVVPDNPWWPAMTALALRARAFIRDDDGVTLIEYGLLAMLIALLCVVALKAIGPKIATMFSTFNNQL